MLTQTQLRRIMPNLAPAKLDLYLPYLNQAMQVYGVDRPLRTAAFAAQLAHESAEFRYMEEIWGPSAAQLRYEPPSSLAARLGNTQPGDGKRFKGRGPIQITGRYNYKKYGGLLRLGLVDNPALAAAPQAAFATAGLYWQSNGLNELADAQDFVAITKRINGGTNGLPDRQKYYERAKGVLAAGFVAQAPRALRAAAPRALPKGTEPLTRGHEAIVEEKAKSRAKVAGPAAPVKAKKVAVRKAAKTAPAKKTPAKRVPAKRASAKASNTLARGAVKPVPKKASKKT